MEDRLTIRVDGLSESFQLEIVLDITEGLERTDGQDTLSAEIGIAEQMLIKKVFRLACYWKRGRVSICDYARICGYHCARAFSLCVGSFA